MIQTVVESVKQRVMEPCADSDAGLAIAEDIPGQAHARFGKKQCAIVDDGVGLDARSGVENPVRAGINAGAALRF